MKNRRHASPMRKSHRTSHEGPRPTKSNVRVSLGIHAVSEALRVRPKEISKLIVKKNWESSKDLKSIVHEARRHRLTIEEKEAGQMDRIGSQNQGIICEINGRPRVDLENLGQNNHSIVLALDGVEDPHNLGAILRTAWLMGVQAVLVPSDRAVGLVPTVHKVSCGGVEHVPVLEVPNLSNVLTTLKEKGYWIFGLAAGGKHTLETVKIPEKIVWVLGAEDKGLRTTTERVCDELVSIPQLDNAASYNVSVATGITLYETRRQVSAEKL